MHGSRVTFKAQYWLHPLSKSTKTQRNTEYNIIDDGDAATHSETVVVNSSGLGHLKDRDFNGSMLIEFMGAIPTMTISPLHLM